MYLVDITSSGAAESVLKGKGGGGGAERERVSSRKLGGYGDNVTFL